MVYERLSLIMEKIDIEPLNQIFEQIGNLIFNLFNTLIIILQDILWSTGLIQLVIIIALFRTFVYPFLFYSFGGPLLKPVSVRSKTKATENYCENCFTINDSEDFVFCFECGFEQTDPTKLNGFSEQQLNLVRKNASNFKEE